MSYESTRPHGPAGPATNRLLARIALHSRQDASWLEEILETVELSSGRQVTAPGTVPEHVYFPDGAVLSLVNHMTDGSAAEVGTVGHEGLVSVATVLGGGVSLCEVLAQIPGSSRRAIASDFVSGLETRPLARREVNRYAVAYMNQVAQTAACNRLHGIEQRCARWLLMTHDRVDLAESFPLTQEFLAFMLGVRRAGVTVAAGALQQAGLIQYHRGAIRVRDRAGLERASCECYQIVRREFDSLLN
jgi:CRP-like cAMP-binding protein